MTQSAVRNWTESFARERERSNGSEPVWLRGARQRAIAAFEEHGFPTRRDEDWKYTNLAPITNLAFRPGGPPPAAPPPSALARLGLTEARGAGAGARLVFVNGRLESALCRPAGDEGVEVGSLAALLTEDPGVLETHLGRLLTASDAAQGAFAALNAAFFTDGAFVHVGPGAEPAPVEIVFLSVPGAEPEATHPRVLVVADPSSRCTVVEAYAGEGTSPTLTNAVSEVLVGDNAAVHHVRVQLESEAAFHVSNLAAHQARNSRFTARSLSFGGALTRNEVRAELGAEGAECTLDGLFVARGSQHVDNHTTIDHRRPHGVSRELYKGILTGAARGVFNGRIVVHPDAQKTDARQKNANLLLSEQAEIDTKPQLEIHADDVKCSHGSTIGHLQEDALFYLRSRGLSELSSRTLLTRGFAAEITDPLPFESLRRSMGGWIAERLFGASAAEEIR